MSCRVKSKRQGSVLVSLVAAMLILFVVGLALSELFGAQRIRAVLALQSSQAFWIADAGLWHAAYNVAAVGPVTFAGGSYTVTKSGDVYTATATKEDATRVHELTFTDPLDETASAATAAKSTSDTMTLDLVSSSAVAAELESFSLSADTSTVDVTTTQLAAVSIWNEALGVALPTGVTALNLGTAAQRTVASGASPTLSIQFVANPTGTIVYTLVLAFTKGPDSTITFTVAW